MTAPLVICPYCFSAAPRCDGVEIRKDLAGKAFDKCDPCQAWIAVDPLTNQPRGRLANSFLRKAKHDAYGTVYRMRELIMTLHGIPDRKHAECKAFGILAEKMGIERREFQIPWFDVAQCEAATAHGTAYIEANK